MAVHYTRRLAKWRKMLSLVVVESEKRHVKDPHGRCDSKSNFSGQSSEGDG